MRHFLSTADLSAGDLDTVLASAAELKSEPLNERLRGRAVALLFLNPSMRTRASFQIGVQQMGGIAVVLEPGKGAWGIEFEPGATMSGEAEEHVAEVAGVLSRYCDLIGLRAFPGFRDWQHDRRDPLIRALAEHASVPVINMETIVHPCQELALAMTLREKLGSLAGAKFLLTWTWHPRPLNTAVANSALTIATRLGMDVTLLCPEPDYLLDEQFMRAAQENATAAGSRLTVSHDIRQAYAGAHFVYAKSWGALPYYGRPDDEWELRQQYRHFIVDQAKMDLTDGARFSHCLPLRRNVKATDEVMDADYCVAVDEAENRLHVQKAVMLHLLDPEPSHEP